MKFPQPYAPIGREERVRGRSGGGHSLFWRSDGNVRALKPIDVWDEICTAAHGSFEADS